jgi:hypothetical protein
MMFLLSGVVIFATGILYVGLPASPDQLELDYLAGLVLSGGRPYVDFVDNNWPGGYLLHMVSAAFFGHSFHSWRLLDYLLMLFGLFFLCKLLLITVGKSSALWAAFLYPCFYTTAVSFWFPGQRDAVIANLFWATIWSHWRGWKTGRPQWQLFTGFLIAVAILIKPTAIIIGPLLVLHGLWWSMDRNGTFRSVFLYQEGMAIVAGLCTLSVVFTAIFFMGTPITSLLDSVWFFNIYPQGSGRISSTILLQKALSVHIACWHWITLVSLISAGWLFFVERHIDVEVKFLFAVVWIAGWSAYFIQGRGFIYHLAIVYAGMLPFIFIGLGKLDEFLLTGISMGYKLLLMLIMGIVLVGAAKKYDSQYAATFRWLTGRLSTVEYYDNFSAGDDMSLGDVYRLLPKLRASIAPGETLLMIGTQSAANFVLNQRQPIRFYYLPIFLEARRPVDMVNRWNVNFRDEINRDHSPMALVNRSFLENLPSSHNDMTIESLRLLKSHLAEHFIKIQEFNKVDLYQRRH